MAEIWQPKTPNYPLSNWRPSAQAAHRGSPSVWATTEVVSGTAHPSVCPSGASFEEEKGQP